MNRSKRGIWVGAVDWLYQCQYPGCDTVLQLCKMLPLEETSWRVHKISLYYFLQLHVNLQLAQNKKLN